MQRSESYCWAQLSRDSVNQERQVSERWGDGDLNHSLSTYQLSCLIYHTAKQTPDNQWSTLAPSFQEGHTPSPRTDAATGWRQDLGCNSYNYTGSVRSNANSRYQTTHGQVRPPGKDKIQGATAIITLVQWGAVLTVDIKLPMHYSPSFSHHVQRVTKT